MCDTSGCVVTAQKPPPSRSTQHTGALRRSSAYSAKGSPTAYSDGSVRRPASAIPASAIPASATIDLDDQPVGTGIALRFEEGVVRLERPRTVGDGLDTA